MSDQSQAPTASPAPDAAKKPTQQPITSSDSALKGTPVQDAGKTNTSAEEKSTPEKSAPEEITSKTDSADSAGDQADEPRASDAARRGIAAAAANPGSAATKRKLREDGRKNLGSSDSSIINDFRAGVTAQGFIAGDQIINNYGAATTQPSGHFEIPSTDREEVAATYIEPDGFASLITFCAQRRIAVIRILSRQGKAATGLRVLDKLCTGPLFRLDPAEGVRHLHGDDVIQNSGYLLTGLTQSQADAQLTRHNMDRLDAELKDRRARIVVIVPAETRLNQLWSADYVTNLSHRPANRDVFISHLTRKVGRRKSDWLMKDDGIASILEMELRPDTPLRKVVQLAWLMANAAQESDALCEIVATVRNRLATSADCELADWFQDLNGLTEHSFVLALAVLNNLPYETVANASRALEALLAVPVTGQLEDVPREDVRPFEHPINVRLKTFDAKLTSTIASTPQGDVPVKAVEFVNPHRPKEVFYHVWREYHQAHKAIIEWLYKLGAQPVEEVRTRAGVAVGLLSGAFDFMRYEVVERWACATNPILRESAATALDAANRVPALKETVHGLVHEWSIDDNPNIVATAVRAYGTSVGLDQPGRSFETLNQHAESSDSAVIDAVCWTLAELVDAQVLGISSRALMTARKWTSSRTRARRITGNLAFLTMAADLLWSPEGTPLRGRVGRGQHWPLLLRLAGTSPEWRKVIAGMWATALLSADIGEIAKDVLDQWIEGAEVNDERRHALVRVLVTTAETSSRADARLCRMKEQWADCEGAAYAPRTAMALFART